MTGVIATWGFVLGCVGLGLPLVRRLRSELDPALQLGLSGAISLGLAGTLLLFFGLAGALQAGILLITAASLPGLWLFLRSRVWQASLGEDSSAWLFRLPIGFALGLALFGVLAPSDMLDWDSLAYHLAVPKIWLEAGRIHPIPQIHHSNFPFAVDNLHLLGLWWGGEQGAKAFQWSFALLAILSAFGYARQEYGAKAAWWSALAVATIPILVWQAGTAYIDVANGLYGGFGLLLAGRYLAKGDKGDLWIAGLLLGLCAGSKFTGLQWLGCVGVALLLLSGKAAGRTLVAALPALGIALLLAVPWLAKNAAWTGNPVYPFFYEKLGGRGWDQRRADIYKNEQQTFGAGREKVQPVYTLNPLQPARFGHAVLGLGYQPGRYVNPGQTEGMGNPLGAVGLASLAGLLLWSFSGRARKAEGVVLLAVGLNFGLWFFLSQQSRYLMPAILPLAVLCGAGVARLPLGRLGAAAITVQAAMGLYAHYTLRATDQMEVAFGKIDPVAYREQRVGFAAAAKQINSSLTKSDKVALYDEVFGYLLDVPYVWANPGHSTEIPYDRMETGADFVREMKALGFTHVYVNLSPSVKDPVIAQAFVDPLSPLPEDRRTQLFEDWQQRFNVLLLDALREGLVTAEPAGRRGLLIRLDG